MLTRFALAFGLMLVTVCGASAQTMRFNTNVGSFDMVLNPNNDPNLQPLVDNIVAYIGLGRYHFTAINRAVEGGAGTADDFVLQMGGFQAFPPVPDLWATMLQSVDALDPVTVDADDDGQVDFNFTPNTRGTVSLALAAGQPNSGTSSFFINLKDNSDLLDPQGFVPFARIENMATVDKIMQLTQRDLSSAVGQPGSAAFTDVPTTDDGRLVVLKSVTVANAPSDFSFVGPVLNALKTINFDTSAAAVSSSSSAALMASDAIASANNVASLSAVPEPSTVVLSLAGMLATFLAARRRR